MLSRGLVADARAPGKEISCVELHPFHLLLALSCARIEGFAKYSRARSSDQVSNAFDCDVF